MEKKYVYKSTLSKVYGLTPSMIEELGPPDEVCDNPHYRSGPAASLYLIERVEAWIEANQERVDKARASRIKRSAAMKAVQDTKRLEQRRSAEAWAKSVQITVEEPLPATLLEDAPKSFRLPEHADPITSKGLHAYVRHRLTNYEMLLQELRHNAFSLELYPLLRRRVDEAVTSAIGRWSKRTQKEVNATGPS